MSVDNRSAIAALGTWNLNARQVSKGSVTEDLTCAIGGEKSRGPFKALCSADHDESLQLAYSNPPFIVLCSLMPLWVSVPYVDTNTRSCKSGSQMPRHAGDAKIDFCNGNPHDR